MSQYTVQRGDTIAQVTQRLQTDWKTLRSQNPEAIGKSRRNGNWFLKEGATVEADRKDFASVLKEAGKPPAAANPAQDLAAATEATDYTVQAGDTLWDLAVNRFHVNLEDLVRDNNIVNPDLIQVGQQLKIGRPAVAMAEGEVTASWYGKNFHGKPMANGQPYNMYANTIAHKELPLGTEVELNNPRTGESTTAVVTDRGPYIEGRDVDLSYGLARKLSLLEGGIGTLIMKIL